MALHHVRIAGASPVVSEVESYRRSCGGGYGHRRIFLSWILLFTCECIGVGMPAFLSSLLGYVELYVCWWVWRCVRGKNAYLVGSQNGHTVIFIWCAGYCVMCGVGVGEVVVMVGVIVERLDRVSGFWSVDRVGLYALPAPMLRTILHFLLPALPTSRPSYHHTDRRCSCF
ncbi:hypothetical protein K458DRAFT_132965 [Lentithecium fluviatile CBS 122367]|uniref:Transmembrane protein n=1 Tax=Lentithecium fluviatile CBS 122367 TaxID=1168545 RepID=A0A6G1ILK8_9PLEO|nr:hypothetical protein K458DRAFT_132965 [Lentithecium fluviatile CBS 122367]